MSEFPRYSARAAERQPRPYQEECVTNALRSLDGQRPALLHIATGGGKTFVANNVIANYLDHDDYALWITKDWWLLRQAATDIAQRQHGFDERLRRLGGDHRELHYLPSYSKNDGLAVLYTTLQSFKQRLDGLPSAHPKLIVWDECHWGYSASSGKALMGYARDRSIPVLGLTATPTFPDDFQIACSHSFRDLVSGGFLADYKAFTCETGVNWEPRRHNNSDFTDESLRLLSEDKGRNHQIVDEYVNKAKFYGKSIFFACNIEHAEVLTDALERKAVAARAVHSELTPNECEEIVRRFANSSELRVLVNVAKLTHGVSIPDINSIFLCRPTTSEVLFTQMVGRGAHTDSAKKKTFNLVEFTDNLVKFENVFHAKDFSHGETRGGAYARKGDNRKWRHKFDRGLEPAWTGDEVPKEARDLWYREGQTFGIEFELTSEHYEDMFPLDEGGIERTEYWRVGKGLLRYLRRWLGSGKVRARPCKEYHEDEDYSKWKIEPDSSVGWEVISPVLEGQRGLIELHNACAALSAAVEDDDLGLHINWRCGTHVHIGWDDENVAKALLLTHLLEPVLRSLVPPSRFAEFCPERDGYDIDTPNKYCRQVSAVYEVEELDGETSMVDVESMAKQDRQHERGRTVGLNVTPLFGDAEHIEVRLLGGTTEAGKLLPWLSLWMRILWRAERCLGEELRAAVREPEDAFPGLSLSDVLCEDVIGVPDDRKAFVKRLERRQREIFRIWTKHDDLHGWLPRSRRHWELDVDLILAAANLRPNTHDFTELDADGQKWAVWSTLVGEGSQDRDRAIRLSAARLQEQGWLYFERLRQDGPLYGLIGGALQSARRDGADGWFDIPHNTEVRAFRRFDEMRDEDWRRCVVEVANALTREGAKVLRSEVPRLAFEESRRRFGVERQNLVQSVERRIRSAINSCIRRRYLRREGREGLVLN